MEKLVLKRQDFQILSQYEDKSRETSTIFREDTIRSIRFDEALSDVEGQNHVVQGIKEYILGTYKQPNPNSVRATILLVGDGGTGKTMCAKRIAQALNIPYFNIDCKAYNHRDATMYINGMHKSYKASTWGKFRDIKDESSVGVIELSDVDLAHPNVLNVLSEVFQKGAIKDLFLGTDVGLHEFIVVVTTKAGKSYYNRNLGRYNFANVTKEEILDILRKEKRDDGAPVFNECLLKNLFCGKVIMMNKHSPGVVQRILERKIKEIVSRKEKENNIKIHIDEEELARLIILGLDANLDIHSAISEVEEFFNRNIARSRSNVIFLNKYGYFSDLFCKLDLKGFSDEIDSIFYNDAKHRILIYSQNQDKSVFDSLKGENIELYFCDDKTDKKYLNSIYPVCQIVETDQENELKAKRFFESQLSKETPIYVFNRGSATKDTFYSYTDKGAYDYFSKNSRSITKEEWFNQIKKNLILNYAKQRLVRTNKQLKFETKYDYNENEKITTISVRDAWIKASISDDDLGLFTMEYPSVTFNDVIGCKRAIEELKDAVEGVKNPIEFLRRGERVPRAILLYGAPGVGKTYLAKALANYSNMLVMVVNTNNISCAQDFIKCAQIAKKYSALIFIDEAEKFLSKRGDNIVYQNRNELVTAFLTELDGFSTDIQNPALFVCATNFDASRESTSLDEAALRRFDHRIRLELPTLQDRIECLSRGLKKHKPNRVTKDFLKNVAQRTIGYSFAELDMVIENSAKIARRKKCSLSNNILNEELENFAHGEKRENTQDTLKRVAYHEAGHALVGYLNGDTPTYITITPRTKADGYVYTNNEEIENCNITYLENAICRALAGRMAEIEFFGKLEGVNSGASSDLSSATRIAKDMVCRYAMDEDSLMIVEYDNTSGEERAELNKKINEILKAQANRAKTFIQNNKNKMDKLVCQLLKNNSLTKEEFINIVEQED